MKCRVDRGWAKWGLTGILKQQLERKLRLKIHPFQTECTQMSCISAHDKLHNFIFKRIQFHSFSLSFRVYNEIITRVIAFYYKCLTIEKFLFNFFFFFLQRLQGQ